MNSNSFSQDSAKVLAELLASKEISEGDFLEWINKQRVEPQPCQPIETQQPVSNSAQSSYLDDHLEDQSLDFINMLYQYQERKIKQLLDQEPEKFIAHDTTGNTFLHALLKDHRKETFSQNARLFKKFCKLEGIDFLQYDHEGLIFTDLLKSTKNIELRQAYQAHQKQQHQLLFEAIQQADLYLVKKCIEKGADITCAFEGGVTVLEAAIRTQQKSQEIIILLCKSGARVTPKIFNILSEPTTDDDLNTNIADYLLKLIFFDHCKMSPEQKNSLIDFTDKNYIEMPPYQAARKGNIALLSLYILYFPELLSEPPPHRKTLLYYAIENDRWELINFLLKQLTSQQLPLETAEPDKCNPLLNIACQKWYAATSEVKYQYIWLIDELIQKGCRIDEPSYETNQETPLQLLIKNYEDSIEKTILTLIWKGANINVKNREHETLLQTAAKKGQRRLTELLIAQRADIASTTPEGDTALSLSIRECLNGDATYDVSVILEVLLPHIKDLNAINPALLKKTALSYAIERYFSKIQLLLNPHLPSDLQDRYQQHMIKAEKMINTLSNRGALVSLGSKDEWGDALALAQIEYKKLPTDSSQMKVVYRLSAERVMTSLSQPPDGRPTMIDDPVEPNLQLNASFTTQPKF